MTLTRRRAPKRFLSLRQRQNPDARAIDAARPPNSSASLDSQRRVQNNFLHPAKRPLAFVAIPVIEGTQAAPTRAQVAAVRWPSMSGSGEGRSR